MRKTIIIIGILSCINLFGQQQVSTLNISGKASKNVTPDKAVFDLELSTVKKTEAESANSLNDLIAEIAKRLKSEGLNENQIKMKEYSIEVKNEYHNDKTKKVGYIASQKLEVIFPLDKKRVMKLYNMLTADKIEGVSINFYTECSDSLKDKIQKELIELALKDGKEKAELIASKSDCKIKYIIDISYDIPYNFYYPPSVKNSVRFVPPRIMPDDGVADYENLGYFIIKEQEFNEDIKLTYAIQSNH